MKEWVKRYLLECLLFTGLAIYYVLGVSPVMTFLSQAGDAFDYIVGAKYFWSVRPTGYPTYIITGWFFERLPGNDFWKLGLLSSVCAWLSCVFIYLSVFHLTKNRLASVIGSLTFAGSFLIWTQSVVPEVYTMNVLVMLAAIYFIIRGWWYIAAIPLALGVGLHHTIMWTLFPILAFFLYLKYKRDSSVKGYNFFVLVGIICLGFLTYIQAFFCVHWEETTRGIRTITSQSSNSLSFVLGLPLVQTWDRVLEAVPILLTGVGVSLILLLFVDWKNKILLFIGLLAVFHWSYYFFSNIPMWVVYAIPAFAFMAILAGVGASRFPYRKDWLSIFVIVPVLFCSLNLGLYDLGRSVDPTPTGAERYWRLLESLPDRSVVYTIDEWLEVYYYSVETDMRVLIVFEGECKYHYEDYKAFKERQGLTFPSDPAEYGELSRNEKFYSEWDGEKFVKDLQLLNMDREIYHVKRIGETFETAGFVATNIRSSLCECTTVS